MVADRRERSRPKKRIIKKIKKNYVEMSQDFIVERLNAKTTQVGRHQ